MACCRECGRSFSILGASKLSDFYLGKAHEFRIDPTDICEDCLIKKVVRAETLLAASDQNLSDEERIEKSELQHYKEKKQKLLGAPAVNSPKKVEKKSKIREDLSVKYSSEINAIIVATFPPPAEWTKDIVGVVNGSSVIGTGPIVSIASTITDFFGAEAYGHIEKIEKAKNNAIQRLKEDAFLMGANMVFGVQVNINEITAGHGMLLVAATGTALNHKEE